MLKGRGAAGAGLGANVCDAGSPGMAGDSGREPWSVAEREVEIVPGGLSVRLREILADLWRPAVLPTGTGGHVWPAAHALAEELAADRLACLPAGYAAGRRILELGAGCGLCGLVAAALAPHDAEVVLTDKDDAVLDGLEHNIALNAGVLACPTRAARLDWAEVCGAGAPALGAEREPDGEAVGWQQIIGAESVDLLLGSDLVWMDDHAELVAQVAQVLVSPEGRLLLAAPAERGGLVALRRALPARGFEVEETARDVSGTPCVIFSCRRLAGAAVEQWQGTAQ